VYGDGNQTRAFCYVADLIDGLIQFIATDDSVIGPINIGNPAEISVRELAKRIVNLSGARSEIVTRPLPQDDPVQRCPDISLARERLGWEPRTGLDDELKRMIAFFRAMLSRSP
jgi:UDP-glucuronate decarboxylase